MQTRINLMGESEHWRGELDTTVTNKRADNGEYTIFYKKDNLEDIKDYKININEGMIIRKEDGGLASNSIKFPITRTKGSMVSKNEDQTIVIEWTDMNGNNFEENFILREKKQEKTEASAWSPGKLASVFQCLVKTLVIPY